MRITGLTNALARLGRRSVVERSKASGLDLVTHIPAATSGWFSWWPTVKEPFTGAWQRNLELRTDTALAHGTAWACITLIAKDIAKNRLKLIADEEGIWVETTNSAYSPLLRKPNHFQNRIQFLMCWVISKLTRGNTYVLKERDGSNRVVGLYVLDPSRVQVLVAPNGEVYYKLQTDPLSGLGEDSVTVPAREIIHDIMIPLYHPLCGVSPFYALGAIVPQGLKIIQNSEKHFANGSRPGGVLTSAHTISNDVADRIRRHWEANYAGDENVGRVAVLGDGLKYEAMTMTAVDSQLIEQLKWGDEKVCSVLHVPPYMVGVGPMPSNSIGELKQQYYSQCLQWLIECIELCIDEGIGLSEQLGIECDLENLLRMDSATQMDELVKGVRGGIDTPNEARRARGKKPIFGGDTVYLQQQDFSMEALAKRDASDDPFGKGTTSPAAPPIAAPTDETDKSATNRLLAFRSSVRMKSYDIGLFRPKVTLAEKAS